MKICLVILLASFALCLANDSQYIPPVILVPGDGGAQMEARLDKPTIIHYVCSRKTEWFSLWLNIQQLLPVVIDCWIDNMRLDYNNVTRKTSNPPGVQTRMPGFGNTTTVEFLDPSLTSYTDYFNTIVNTLVGKLGYERGVTVRAAPFDFRRAPNEQVEYYERLKWLIEETSHKANNRRVVLMLHSMGGPMTWYFLTKQPQWWKTKYLESVVGLAGAWGGSVKAVKVYTAGDNLGVRFLSALKVRTEQRTAPSLSFLLPNRDLWHPDEALVQTPTMNYTVDNFKDLFEKLNLPDAYNMYLDTRGLLRGAPPPGVEMHCLYGTGIDTVESVVYATESQFPDSPSLLNGDGDGTVNLRSAQVCQSWAGKQKQPVHVTPFKNMEHMAILRNPAPINHIMDVLGNITAKNKKIAEEHRNIENGRAAEDALTHNEENGRIAEDALAHNEEQGNTEDWRTTEDALAQNEEDRGKTEDVLTHTRKWRRAYVPNEEGNRGLYEEGRSKTDNLLAKARETFLEQERRGNNMINQENRISPMNAEGMFDEEKSMMANSLVEEGVTFPEHERRGNNMINQENRISAMNTEEMFEEGKSATEGVTFLEQDRRGKNLIKQEKRRMLVSKAVNRLNHEKRSKYKMFTVYEEKEYSEW